MIGLQFRAQRHRCDRYIYHTIHLVFLEGLILLESIGCNSFTRSAGGGVNGTRIYTLAVRNGGLTCLFTRPTTRPGHPDPSHIIKHDK